MLLQACLNGAREQAEHPAIPVTPAEIAHEARRAVDAGAGAIHVHPRGPDGRESLDPMACATALDAVRAVCPGTPIGLTTGLWIVGGVKVRLDLVAAWRVLPDFVSVNFSEAGAEELAELAIRLGIGVEAGLSDPTDARRMLDATLEPRCVRVLVEIDQEDDSMRALARAEEIDEILDARGSSRPRLHHGHGVATWAVIERAIRRRHDVRVGLEDTLVLPDGRTARDNGELIAAAVSMARAAGRTLGSRPHHDGTA